MIKKSLPFPPLYHNGNFITNFHRKVVFYLNPNKAHGPDKISIPMICGKSLRKPLKCSSCTQKRQQALKNYRPISLLPIFGKIFEIIYNIFEYLTTKKFILVNQSGFKPSDSCVNQL